METSPEDEDQTVERDIPIMELPHRPHNSLRRRCVSEDGGEDHVPLSPKAPRPPHPR